ncbi:TauD/TfdA family dioxygenase [Herbidospora mongoliensis]|uniref:TauD/TfdA family dioxygenase n=1 Tax=Herbidospora mongoliensis TaxID=688067 RepID=UPI00082D8F6E|nr:TauD/TfdA family dioxygenase [Herbidospora mongoliensis]
MRVTEMTEAEDRLATRGWVVVRGSWDVPTHAQALRFAARFGRPSSRDGGRPVWEVRPRPLGGTFSQRSGPVPLHTDAQYHPDPEDVVCLFAVRPAVDGGHSLLLSADQALTALRRHPEGARAEAALRRPQWSWTTPAVFSENPGRSSPPAPVFAGETLRWRPDNLVPVPESSWRAAASVFTDVLVRVEPVEVRLAPGDVLLVDNHRTLHGRTSFADLQRLMFRIRLWSR